MPRQPYPPPRDWLVKHARDQFGRLKDANWDTDAATTDLDRALLAAAQNQHRLSRSIRLHGEGQGLNTTALANAVNLTPPTIRAILYGRQHASLAELHALAAAVGLSVRADLRTPTHNDDQ